MYSVLVHCTLNTCNAHMLGWQNGGWWLTLWSRQFTSQMELYLHFTYWFTLVTFIVYCVHCTSTAHLPSVYIPFWWSTCYSCPSDICANGHFFCSVVMCIARLMYIYTIVCNTAWVYSTFQSQYVIDILLWVYRGGKNKRNAILQREKWVDKNRARLEYIVLCCIFPEKWNLLKNMRKEKCFLVKEDTTSTT